MSCIDIEDFLSKLASKEIWQKVRSVGKVVSRTVERGRLMPRKLVRNWRFFDREKRYDNWEPVLKPEFDDWIELLDGVDRRVHRRLLQPQDANRLRQKIKELFPGADVPKPS
jgi:hypothetical protein